MAMLFVFHSAPLPAAAAGTGGRIALAAVQVVWRGEGGWAVRGAPFRQHDALFRTFSEIEPTPAGIAAFTRQFASSWAVVDGLAVDKDGRLVLFLPRSAEEKRPFDWRDQVFDLRQCVRLWDLVRAGDDRGLARHIRWQSDAARGLSIHYDSHPDLNPGNSPSPPDKRVTALIASADTDPELLQSL